MKKLFLCFLCFIILASCSSVVPTNIIQKSEYLFGTLVSIKIYDFGEAEEDVIDECFSMITEYEHIFSYSDPDSELSYLNSSAYNNPVMVSESLFSVIADAIELCRLSDGAFDIGLGRLIEIWDEASFNSIPPQEDEISDYIGFRGYEHIVVDYEKSTVMFTDERIAVHLGACAKGYAEDKVVDFLRINGVKSAVVDFGGSIAVIGNKGGLPFNIGITDPTDENSFIGSVGISDSCVVTSGDYRRYFIYDGVRYHHILDSETAYPALSDIKGVSVICESAFQGDCLSTAAFVAGSKAAAELIEEFGCGYVIITEDYYKTSGVLFNENIE